MAEKVRRIFNAAGLNIADTVKFNLIFFRSARAGDMTDKALIGFSEEKVLHILDRIKPAYIITEGFATFERLLTLKSGTTTGFEKDARGRRLLLVGKTGEGTKVLGMRHPSGSRLSNEALEALGRYIQKHIG